MSKSGSNKGIYLFWGTIILVVIVVLLVIFIPRTKPYAPYNNMLGVQNALNAQNQQHKNIDFFVESFIQDPLSNPTHKQNLENLYTLQGIMTSSNPLCLNALLYTTPQGDFKNLTSQQTHNATALASEAQNFLTYCTTFVTSLFDGTMYQDREYSINQTLPVFYEKYCNFIEIMGDFYHSTALIMHSSATKCMEMPATLLDQHLNLIKSVHTFTTSTAISPQEAHTLSVTASQIYAPGYYKSLI